MSEYKQIKINNSKNHAVNSKWKEPGAAFYDQLLNAFYCDGGVPADSEGLEKAMKSDKYKQWPDYLKEAYLVAPVKDIKNSPYGVTPYSKSGCKYPHHVIRDGELVLSIQGIKHAYETAWRHNDLNTNTNRHLNRHLKELGLRPQFHHGVICWFTESEANLKIESNFRSIEKFIFENTGIDLHCPTTLLDEEVGEGVIRPLLKEDIINPYFVKWLFKSSEFSEDDPEKFDYDILVNDESIGNFCYGYFVDEKLEGIIKVKYHRNEDYYSISMLFVNSENESKGIGQTLMKYVIDKYGDKEMRLNVFAFNDRAMHIYKKYGFDVISSAVAEPEADGDSSKLVGQKFYKMVRKPTEYDPPLSFDKLPDHLKNDPVHAWRAKTGIELIHKEPTLDELDRIWVNWNKMSSQQKLISDQKSMELFDQNNKDHYMELVKEYDMTSDHPDINIFPSGHFSEYNESIDILNSLIFENGPQEKKSTKKDFVPIYGIIKSYSSSTLRNDGTPKTKEELSSVKFDKIIHKLTRGDNYSHALVSFDDSLTKMYSYEDDGFVVDNILEKDSWMGTKSIYICVMFVPKSDRDRMKEFVKQLKENQDSTKYASANLLKAFVGTPYKVDKRFVCSSFTGYIMSCANPKNLHRDYSRLRPEDITILPRAFYVANVIDREDFKKRKSEIRRKVNAIYDEYLDEIDDYNNHLPKLMLLDRCDELKTIDRIFDWIINRL